MLYLLYELSHAAMLPARVAVHSYNSLLRSPLNPFASMASGATTATALELMERFARRYNKPEFGIREVISGGAAVRVTEHVVWKKPFCRLVHFRKAVPAHQANQESRLLMVAPLSGHHATLLRGTVAAMLPDHDVYITDWMDARGVPLKDGSFDLNTYIDYLTEICRMFEGRLHIMAVGQAAVPALAATAYLEARRELSTPQSVVLVGGPIDTRVNPTAMNRLAQEHGLEWFRANAISTVPWPNAGHGRRVHAGLLPFASVAASHAGQLQSAHKELFLNLIRGDGDTAERHEAFFDEYLAVMDLTAEFYLQTVESVFIKHDLPKGEFIHHGRKIDLAAIKHTPLMTIEGEDDDITAPGQCRAAHDLCQNLPQSKKAHYTQPGTGHYGIFNGAHYRQEIAPRIAAFIEQHNGRSNWPKFWRRLLGKIAA